MADSRWLDAALLVLTILLSSWISSQFGQLAGHQKEANIAKDYGYFSMFALIVLIASAANIAFFDFIGIGTSDNKRIIPLLLLGAVVGFLVTSQGKSFFIKLLGPGAINPALGFAFVNILAPISEAYFFRAALYPSIRKFLSNRTNATAAIIVAAVLVSLAFALWHTVATGGVASALVAYFVLSMVFIGLTHFTKSIAPELGGHSVLNFING